MKSWKDSNSRLALFSTAVLALALSGCITIQSSRPQEKANKELAREFFAAINRADSDAVHDFYAEDGHLWTAGNLPFSGTYDREQIKAAMDGIMAVFPEGLEITILEMTAEGNRVAIEAESRGKTVTGSTYNNHYHFLFVVNDGKVALFKEYMDTKHAFDVLVAPFIQAQ